MLGVDLGEGSGSIGWATAEARVFGGLSVAGEGYSGSEVDWEGVSDGGPEAGFLFFVDSFRSHSGFQLCGSPIVARPALSSREYQR